MSVFWQDLKFRKVYWFWFPIIAVCCGFLLWKRLPIDVFIVTMEINLIFIFLLLGTVWAYSGLKLKTSIKNTFGLGDALFFIALAFSFTSTSFIILFVFGLLYALVMHLILKHKSKYDTVPLAGYLSLFFGLVYLAHWLGFLTTFYQF